MQIKSCATITAKVQLVLTENEVRALHALTKYGTKPFLKVFYEHLGRDCLEPYEQGLFSLFETIGGELPQHLKRIDNARDTFNTNS